MARKSKHYSQNSLDSVHVNADWRVGVYLRLSREDGDKEESDSIGNQKELLNDYIERQDDLVFERQYADDGWTGTNFERPEFKQMMEDIKHGIVNCVIVKDLSRFGRNYIDVGQYLEKVFPLLDVRFISVNDHIDSVKDPQSMNNAMVPFKNVMNDEYCRDISNKVRSSLTTKREKGKFIGSFASYGFSKDPADHNHLVIDEDAAAVVRDIYRWFLDGIRIIRIAKKLNEQGVLNPSAYKRSKGLNYRHPQMDVNDSLWPDCSVRRILTNPLYTGHMVQGKTKIKSYRVQVCVNIPSDNWIIVRDTHEAIIPGETFDAVQRLLERDTRTAPNQQRVYALSGCLRCADCQRAMNRKLISHSYGQYCYYVCATFKKMNQSACTKHTIRSDKLEAAVLATIQQQVNIAVRFDKLLNDFKERKMKAQKSDRLETSLITKESEMKRLIRNKADLYPDWKEGLISKEEYILLRERFDAQIKIAEKSIASICSELVSYKETVQDENAFISHFLKHKKLTELTRDIVVELIDMIYVHEGGNITIKFRYRDEYARMIDLMKEYNIDEDAVMAG